MGLSPESPGQRHWCLSLLQSGLWANISLPAAVGIYVDGFPVSGRSGPVHTVRPVSDLGLSWSRRQSDSL